MYPTISVDKEAGAVYIAFGPPEEILVTAPVETVKGIDVSVDYNKYGRVIGIEILSLLYPNWAGEPRAVI